MLPGQNKSQRGRPDEDRLLVRAGAAATDATAAAAYDFGAIEFSRTMSTEGEEEGIGDHHHRSCGEAYNHSSDSSCEPPPPPPPPPLTPPPPPPPSPSRQGKKLEIGKGETPSNDRRDGRSNEGRSGRRWLVLPLLGILGVVLVLFAVIFGIIHRNKGSSNSNFSPSNQSGAKAGAGGEGGEDSTTGAGAMAQQGASSYSPPNAPQPDGTMHPSVAPSPQMYSSSPTSTKGPNGESPTSTAGALASAAPTSESPTMYPTSMSSDAPTDSPSTEVDTPEPTARPSRSPTEAAAIATPAPERQGLPSTLPTTLPTRIPTEAPTRSPVHPPGNDGEYETFSFYVMGDVPYNKKEEGILEGQIKEIAAAPNDNAVFIIHLGDIMLSTKKVLCEEWRYQLVHGLFTRYSELPVFVTPGDNDIYDCPDLGNAWDLWTEYFMAFEENWGGGDFLDGVERQGARRENFAFSHEGVAFIGMNLVDGKTDDSGARMEDNVKWMNANLEKFSVGSSGGRIRAVIFFGHSERGDPVFENMETQMGGLGVPSYYFHGNGHEFVLSNELNGLSWDGFWNVQVDRGGRAPPPKITVRGTTSDAVSAPFRVDSEHQFMIGDFIKLDRRGGLY